MTDGSAIEIFQGYRGWTWHSHWRWLSLFLSWRRPSPECLLKSLPLVVFVTNMSERSTEPEGSLSLFFGTMNGTKEQQKSPMCSMPRPMLCTRGWWETKCCLYKQTFEPCYISFLWEGLKFLTKVTTVAYVGFSKHFKQAGCGSLTGKDLAPVWQDLKPGECSIILVLILVPKNGNRSKKTQEKNRYN